MTLGSKSLFGQENKIYAIFSKYVPGIMVCFLVAMSAKFVSEHYGGPTILFALLMGMALNHLSQEGRCIHGISFSAKTILKVGIALLGARITVEQIMQLGITPIAIVLTTVPSTILFGYLIGKWFQVKSTHSILTGASVGICGASAAIAVSAVLPQDKESEKDLIFTVIAITALSTVAMIAYPLVVTSLGFNDSQAGIFLGATIHDVAQVVGAGYMMSDNVGDVATFTKLMRVAMLVPVVVVISVLATRLCTNSGSQKVGKSAGLPLPGFLIAFILIVLANSFGLLSENVSTTLVESSRWCLIVALVGLGMKASFAELAKMGWRPLALVIAETIFLAALVAVWLKLA